MSIQQRVCPSCGAPLASSTSRCEHCGAWFETSRAAKASSGMQRFLPSLPEGAGEFGAQGPAVLIGGLAIASILYAAGWALEDTQYWLAPGAVALWAAALPLWLLAVAFVWRTQHAAWPVGAAIASGLLLIHLAIMFPIRRRINDDILGIAAIYAALALAGWIMGRLGHFALRKRRTIDPI